MRLLPLDCPCRAASPSICMQPSFPVLRRKEGKGLKEAKRNKLFFLNFVLRARHSKLNYYEMFPEKQHGQMSKQLSPRPRCQRSVLKVSFKFLLWTECYFQCLPDRRDLVPLAIIDSLQRHDLSLSTAQLVAVWKPSGLLQLRQH